MKLAHCGLERFKTRSETQDLYKDLILRKKKSSEQKIFEQKRFEQKRFEQKKISHRGADNK
jgi:hypothetical protein